MFLWKTIKREWDKIDAGGRGGKAYSEGLESALPACPYLQWGDIKVIPASKQAAKTSS